VSSGRTLGVLPLLDAATDDPIATGGEILDGNLSELAILPRNEQSARASLHFAKAFAPALSMQATLGATGTRSTERPFDVGQSARESSTSNGVRGDGAVA